jgi:hypothetical protein
MTLATAVYALASYWAGIPAVREVWQTLLSFRSKRDNTQ